jgi:hypothetical protein
MDEIQDKVRQSLCQVRSGLLQAIEGDHVIAPVHEARVHHAIDLLRAHRADGQMLSRVEQISCTLRSMNLFLREGRVNAYDSARLRLRSVANSL